jgi:hypothetical protein
MEAKDNVRNPTNEINSFSSWNSLTLEDETDTLFRNVGTALPLDAALYSRIAQISSTSRRKPEITAVPCK